MKCAVCGDAKGPFYRANAKGAPAIWACERHLKTKPDADLKRVVDALAALTKETP